MVTADNSIDNKARAVNDGALAVQSISACYGFGEVPTRVARSVRTGGSSMRRLIWLVLVPPLAGCGGDKASTTLSVKCASGTQLVGADSVDVLGDLADGRTAIQFPDPANAGKTGAIIVQPHDHCKITPGNPSL